jgi:carboxypeptidase Taq
MSAYASLERRFHRLHHLDNTLGLLDWDYQTTMPEGAAPSRGETLAVLEGLRHELLTDPAMADELAAAEADTGALDDWQRANLREMRRLWSHAAAVPGDLVEASARAVAAAEMAWRRAKADDDFAALLPALTEVLGLQRQVGEAKADRLGLSLYDALLDEYEPGARSERIDGLFDDLAAVLPGLTEQVLERQAGQPPVTPFAGPFPIEAQRRVGEAVMTAAGFDFARGRLDVSPHPFCGGAANDVRVTTRYDVTDFAKSLMAVLHETGHALYELNRPAAWLAQPVGAARGLALHESQSLAVEMQAGRSREFIAYLAPRLAEAFGGEGEAWRPANLYRYYTRVERGLIRVDADEVTYPAHVILRYRLERAMLAGDLPLADLPGAWAEGMAELVGTTPPDDRTGCLQDIHWPGGGWGYFPTYTLGAMAAAQLFEAACRDEPDLLPGLARGDFAPLTGWLRTHVHAKGSLQTTDDILTEATGRPLGTAAYKAHLERRYLHDA